MMTSFIDAMNNDRCNKLMKRIEYLNQEIAAGKRLDGYTLEGHQEELKRIEKELDKIINNKE